MPAIINRRVSVTRYTEEVSVMLSWYEEGKEEVGDMQSKHFRYANKEVFKSVEETVNLLVDKWAHIFLSGMDMSAVSVPLDANPKRFDWLVETVDPSGDLFLQFARGA